MQRARSQGRGGLWVIKTKITLRRSSAARAAAAGQLQSLVSPRNSCAPFMCDSGDLLKALMFGERDCEGIQFMTTHGADSVLKSALASSTIDAKNFEHDCLPETLADQSTGNCNRRERIVLPEIHGRHHKRRFDEFFHRLDRAQHAVLCGEHDAVGNLYKLPQEREVL